MKTELTIGSESCGELDCDTCNDQRQATADSLRILAAEVRRLRALVDEPQGKQIKPGPDKPVPELDIYCAACGQPSLTSHWFAKSHTAMCPLCAAEFTCNAGRA